MNLKEMLLTINVLIQVKNKECDAELKYSFTFETLQQQGNLDLQNLIQDEFSLIMK